MIKGTVVEWDDARGYGFIVAASGDLRAFFHVSAVRGRRRPRLNDAVAFTASKNGKGRY